MKMDMKLVDEIYSYILSSEFYNQATIVVMDYRLFYSLNNKPSLQFQANSFKCKNSKNHSISIM